MVANARKAMLLKKALRFILDFEVSIGARFLIHSVGCTIPEYMQKHSRKINGYRMKEIVSSIHDENWTGRAAFGTGSVRFSSSLVRDKAAACR
jgi:hypothetical protein